MTHIRRRCSAAGMFLALLCFGSNAFSQGTWTTNPPAPMPTPLFGASAGVINGQLYVAGGCCVTFSYPFTRFNTLQVYDPATNIWTTRSPMPLAVYGAATGVINGKLYVAGGQADPLHGNNVATLQIYDPASDTWTTGASLPQAGAAANAGVIGGKLYVAGGAPPSNIGETNTVVVYDPVADTWSNLAPMPNPPAWAGTAVINGILYVVGGSVPGPNIYTGVATNTVQSYNPVTDTWATLAPMPTARSLVAAGAIDGILYAAGGTDNSSTFATVESYDPVTNTWAAEPSMLTAAYLPAPGVIAGTFYLAGGNTLQNQLLNAVQAFTPNCISLPCIKSPSDGATPQSHFVALSGRGSPGARLTVRINGLPVPGTVTVDAEGLWEALPDIAPYGSSVTVEVDDRTTGNASNRITVHPQPEGSLPGPGIPSLSRLLHLRHGDIFLGADPSSPQVRFYGPKWTHNALYLGGDTNGTPLVAEAVTPDEAGGGQQVRSLALEQSLLWTAPRISGFTSRNPITNATRDEIVGWAKTFTNQGIPYWNVPFEMPGLVLAAALDFSPFRQTHGYVNDLSALNAAKNSTSQFICSTLVWAAYWHGTGQTLDLSDPNNMTAERGSFLGHSLLLRLGNPFLANRNLFNIFIDQLRPVVVVPETFARSPRLKQIF